MAFTGVLDEILRQVDIVDLARRLGLTIGRREAKYTKALCPFHADKTPSLALYPDPGNPHYHCFSCGAHGGALDLVASQRHETKEEALRWLAQVTGVKLPRDVGGRQDDVAGAGRAAFTTWLQRRQRRALLEEFAGRRGLEVSVLQEAGARAVDMGALVPDELPLGEREALEAAGVLGRRRGLLVPIATGKQIVFPLDRERGFIFRALDQVSDKTRRYRFSKGLRKSEVLFGAAVAQEKVQSGAAPYGVFVVEGIMDVLRLRSAGLPAVGILGTSMSRSQANQIERLCYPEGRPVAPVHLFLDADEAGRRATPAAIRALLGIDTPMPIDVIWPDQDGDPDELLRALEGEEAVKQLGDWTYSVLASLVHAYTRLPIYSAIMELAAARPLVRVEALRYVTSQFGGRWPRLRDLVDPSSTYLGTAHREDAKWFLDSLDRAAGLLPLSTNQTPKAYSPSHDILDQPDSNLRLALRLAQSSNFRREYPFDWGGMTRLALAANASLLVGRVLLNDPKRRPIPYAARVVPKDDGRIRLKAGPWPEDAFLQQYVLTELLRARSDAPGWYTEFPAVRFIRSANSGPIFTGPPALRPVGPSDTPPPVVSFAYQIDQEVLEGETPPRREGMFVPYRECWQQFIDHLDDFVARQPLDTDTFFAVRLDISGFFDNLPRYAVENVLRPALGDGAERHFSGRDFRSEVAGLLRSEEPLNGDAGHRLRAEFLADWLTNQTFGFRYFDPADGRVRNAPNSTIGIPQGPDLSAYLANVALFPLDREVTQLIETDRVSRTLDPSADSKAAAVYGRYVDDMVIVSTSETLLSQLESTIGEQLRKLGLAMNAKHERTRALSRRKIREWLLGERGAAVLVSAGGSETPTTNSTHVEDLLQVGSDTSRSQVLQLLHHADLFGTLWARNSEGVSRVVGTLKRLRTMPSVALRYYDWVSAARWCLHSLALREPNAPADEFASRFVTWWREIYGRDVAVETFGESRRDRDTRQEQLDLSPILMAFDALERSIDSRYDRRGGTEPNVRDALRTVRERLAQLVRDGDLCGAILRLVRNDAIVAAALPQVDAMLEIQSLIIRSLSVAAVPGVGALPGIGANASYATRRFFLNALGPQIGAYGAPVMQEVSQPIDIEWAPNAEPLLGLHEAIARLIGDGPKKSDPLAPLAEVIRRWLQLLSAVDQKSVSTGLDAALRILSLSNQFLEQPGKDTEWAELGTALRAFVEIVAGTQDGHALMSTRRHLVSELAGLDSEAIAVPPGVDASGFFAHQGERLSAYTFVNGVGSRAPSEEVVFGVVAKPAETVSERLAKYDCEIPASHRISRPRPPRLQPKSVSAADLAEFARAYRELAAIQAAVLQEEDGDGDRRPLSPLHLLEPTENDAKWGAFGTVTRLPIGPQTFLRLGEHRLHSLAVHANGAHLWQVGFTLADHLGYRGFARSSELDRLIVGTLEPDDTIEAVPFYIMQLTVPRLCGAFMGRTRFQIRPEDGIPSGLERQLSRLNAFQGENSDPVIHLAYLLEAGAEARAAELLREMPAPLQIAGALSAVFRAIGRAAGRPERIFAKTLPPPKLGVVSQRRTVDLWLAAASRLESLPGEIPMGLKTVAAAMRVQAISRLAQALTLEVWSLLRDDDVQLFEHFAPDLSALELPEEVLFVGGSQMQRSPAAGDQVVRLLNAIAQHAAPGATARGNLDHVTPLGWVVALATVTGLLDIEPVSSAEPDQQRPDLMAARNEVRTSPGIDRVEKELWEILAEIGRYLAVGVEDGWTDGVHEADWPWQPFAPLVSDAEHVTARMVRAARLIEGLYGLRASTRQSRLFQLSESDDRGYCVVFRDGDRQNLAGWQIDRDSLGVTRPGDLETRTDLNDELASVWSETTRGNRLVSLSVGYRTLAEFAGSLVTSGIGSEADSVVAQAVSPAPDVKDAPTETPRESPKPVSIPSTAPTAPSPEPTVASPAPPISHRSSASKENSLEVLNRMWHDSRRAGRAMGPNLRPVALRVAILQMNIDHIGHSFYHPMCETNRHKFADWEGFLSDFRRDGKHSTTTLSMFEAWRREILREALIRCQTLEVELLILPEYATRPDTVTWLASEIENLAPQTAVLAGTFRHAAGAGTLRYDTGTGPSRPMSLGAVVPLIVPGPALQGKGRARRNARIYSRLKKYPSTGLSEFMRPESRPLQAVYDMEANDPALPERLRFVRDLICSEVFMAMSPANIYSSVPALLELNRRFGQPVTAETIIAQVMRDIELIAQATSPAIAHEFAHPRQTIIAVPAATTRPFDHHIFGEAGAKAAGLTTAFANMSGLGGQSCFIGHYRSSGVEGSNIWSLESPYHGRAPGIWTYNFSGGKPLGSHETALIVADINPIDSNPPKPARQIETQPLALVAHIPFLLGKSGDEDPVRENAQRVAAKILQLGLSATSQGGGSSCDLAVEDIGIVREIAKELAEIDSTATKSLTFRSEGLRVASMQPHVHPSMPALVDWAYVPAPTVGVEIEAPLLQPRDLEKLGAV